jgi:hypothetical protein
MRLLDVVGQLQLILPKHTDKLSTTLVISSITVSSNVATIITSSVHGLTTGQAVTLSNVQSRTAISGVSQSGNVFTFTTSVDHDLTSTWPDHATVELSGFTDSAWNNSFTLTDVPNRRTFKVQSTNTLPTLNTNEVLLEVRIDGVNGRFSATVSNTTTFTISGTFNDGVYVGGTVSSAVRVAGAVDIERAIDQYTEQNVQDLWAFVVMNDAETSKDRHTFSDATATKTTGQDMRLRLLDGFTITFVANVSTDIAAQLNIDIMRHDLLLPVLQSVYGARFDTGLSGNADFRTVLTGHGISLYNRAVLAYTYSFETVMDLTNDDAVIDQDTRAFRDINYTELIGGDDTTDMTILPIDLDDEPL